MNYIIKLECINPNNEYNYKYGQIVYISEVFGIEKKCIKDKDRAYKFISMTRVNMICSKINKKIFKVNILKSY